MINSKEDVSDFWNEASCGEDLLLESQDRRGYINQSKSRYQLEPFILDFTEFDNYRHKEVLEIGVGLGADHQKFAEAGAVLSGIDLTSRAIDHVRSRFELFNLHSNLSVGDAEALDFKDNIFDLVYSWGVIHHSPNTSKAISEIHRVLKPGGQAKVMIYNKWSIVGLMLWVRYALLALKPWKSLSSVYAEFLESPGTKAYSAKEAKALFAAFYSVEISTVLTHGDLLTSGAGQRHTSFLLKLARKIWPRRLIKKVFKNNGLFLMISVRKS